MTAAPNLHSGPHLPIVPWSFLGSDLDAATEKPSPSKQSFAQFLKQPVVSLSQLPIPCEKGGYVSVKVSEDAFSKGLDCCKQSLIGRVLFT
ncbi:hypothetical protein ACFX1T_013079 [Malus domestica]